jgi:methylmalonyl-CoA mutase
MCADDVRCAREVSPGTSVLRVGSHIFHNAGASTSLELACTLGSGVEYLHQLATRGISVDDACARIEFSFSAGTNIAFEIAKLRAARMLWAKIVHHFSPSDPSSLKMRIHSGGSKWSATVFDRHVNILRGTLETMAAALGGADSITTHPFDIATGDTTELSRRIALNTSMLLADEAGIARVLDPAGGSGYIETLTKELAKSAWEKFQVIESHGGMLSSIIDGHVQSEVAREYKERKQEISKRREVFLGTSKYPDPTEIGKARGAAMGEAESAQLSQRTDEESRLGAFARATEGGEAILARLQRDTLPRESVDVLLEHRGAEVFETIRFLVQQAPHRPRVLLATFGPTAWRRARAGFSSEFLGIAGFDILDHPGYENTDEIISAAKGADVDVVVLCSDDESYLVTGVEIAQQLKSWKAGMIVLLAGNPGADPEVLKNAGVDDWINMRTDAGVFLSGLLPLLGITTPEGMK